MMARAPVDLAATTRDIKTAARAAGNLELISLQPACKLR
jgi:hypothetical protein